MLSRLSSFSGPLSPLFKIPVGGFTADGLILRYVIRDIDSYSGTTNITDLQNNSNGTLISGPTYSINGYINFDGINDYVMTNTSLNSKLSPNTSSTIISVFIWIYPQDDGVIVTEQGTTSLNGGWHTSIIEIVSGQLKFSVWPRTLIITSSISISLNNWYYVGLTYDGTTLRAYVNGQLAGSAVFVRSAPNPTNGLYYAIAAEDTTDLDGQVLSGPGGTYAKMKFGDFHVYNTALSQQQILNNYNFTKSNYIYTEDMLIWIDANDPESFSGGTVFDISGNNYHHSLTSGATLSNIDGIKCFDCATSSKRIAVNGTGPTLSTTGYTYVVWARLGSDISSFRTLLYTKSPRYTPITIPDSTHPDANKLGYWDTNSRSSGYDISSLVGVWAQYSVVGDNSSQTFYINDYQVGSSIPYGSGGTLHDGLGNNLGSSQPFGHVGNMMLYNKKLTQEQIKQNYNALKHVYTPGFVTNDLLLMLDANETSSYPGSGTIWYDIAGSSQNMTLVNSPTFVSGTVSYFDFNGTTQFATGTGVTVPTTAYTKSVWFWVDTYVANNIVSGFNNVGGHFLYMGNSTKILVGHHNQGVAFDTYQSISSISLNTWYNVTVTFNTTSGFKIYINGQLDSSHNMILAHLGSGTTNLGAYSNSGDNFMNGRISKVYTYGRALTESEVEQNFFYDREKFGIEITEIFTTVGSTTWTTPIGVTSVEYLVVAGGGGGGNGYDNAGGGGGAGGMVLTGTINVTPGQSYTITVGDGGIGGANERANNAGTDGENSVFGSITALGGGKGQGSRTGGVAGSAQVSNTTAPTGGAGSGGGNGGKGGGGAGGSGSSNSGTTGGAGGSGVSSSISGTSVTYGAGGAGANAGTQNSGVNGTSNRGNGGRAGGAASANSTGGGNGGSGIVVIKY
jgi:hypothetical protein